jgi:hypothetical protein
MNRKLKKAGAHAPAFRDDQNILLTIYQTAMRMIRKGR